MVYVNNTKKLNQIKNAKNQRLLQRSKTRGLKITWPTKPEVITTTIMVFIFVFLSSIFFC